MRCVHCGYENAIALALCPRCHGPNDGQAEMSMGETSVSVSTHTIPLPDLDDHVAIEETEASDPSDLDDDAPMPGRPLARVNLVRITAPVPREVFDAGSVKRDVFAEALAQLESPVDSLLEDDEVSFPGADHATPIDEAAALAAAADADDPEFSERVTGAGAAYPEDAANPVEGGEESDGEFGGGRWASIGAAFGAASGADSEAESDAAAETEAEAVEASARSRGRRAARAAVVHVEDEPLELAVEDPASAEVADALAEYDAHGGEARGDARRGHGRAPSVEGDRREPVRARTKAPAPSEQSVREEVRARRGAIAAPPKLSPRGGTVLKIASCVGMLFAGTAISLAWFGSHTDAPVPVAAPVVAMPSATATAIATTTPAAEPSETAVAAAPTPEAEAAVAVAAPAPAPRVAKKSPPKKTSAKKKSASSKTTRAKAAKSATRDAPSTRVIHAKKGAKKVELRKQVALTTTKGRTILGTLVAVEHGVVEIQTKQGRVRVAEKKVSDAANF